MATTSALANLKLTPARKSLHVNPIQQRRNKLVRRMWEQIELLNAKPQARSSHPSSTAQCGTQKQAFAAKLKCPSV